MKYRKEITVGSVAFAFLCTLISWLIAFFGDFRGGQEFALAIAFPALASLAAFAVVTYIHTEDDD